MTIYGMTGDGIRKYPGVGSSATITVRHTISVGNGADDFNLEGTINYFDYNMYDPLKITGVTPGANDQPPPGNLDDLFISITSPEDLHLEVSGHNGLDNGESLSGSFLVDIDNETRPNGAAWDIGADEQSGATPKPRIVRWREVEPQ